MKERILEYLERKGTEGALQSLMVEEMGLSKSTLSVYLSDLERDNLIFREKVAGKSNQVWLTEKVPHPIEGKIRVGVLRAAEYPHVLLASEELGDRVNTSVFDSAKEATWALHKGQIDIAFSPLATQILYSLVNRSFKVHAGCACGGCGLIAREPPSEEIVYGSSQLSTMEMNLRAFLEEKNINPYNIEISYFEDPEGLFHNYLDGKIGAASIWEPYLTILESSTEDSETYPLPETIRKFPCCTMGVNNHFLSTNRKIFQEFMETYIEHTRAVEEGKGLKEGAELLSEKTGLDKNLLLASFREYEFTFRLDEDRIMEYIKKFDLKVTPGNLSQVFEPDFPSNLPKGPR